MEFKTEKNDLTKKVSITMDLGLWAAVAKMLTDNILAKYPTPEKLKEEYDNVQADKSSKLSPEKYINVAAAVGATIIVQQVMLEQLEMAKAVASKEVKNEKVSA